MCGSCSGPSRQRATGDDGRFISALVVVDPCTLAAGGGDGSSMAEINSTSMFLWDKCQTICTCERETGTNASVSAVCILTVVCWFSRQSPYAMKIHALVSQRSEHLNHGPRQFQVLFHVDCSPRTFQSKSVHHQNDSRHVKDSLEKKLAYSIESRRGSHTDHIPMMRSSRPFV